MMLNLYVQQNQWIVATLLSGVALMLLFCLSYSAMWRPRDEEKKSETIKATGMRTFFISFMSIVPWVLILLAMASASYTVVSLILRTCYPPNW
jgi:Na+/melibiose symporter-like transporter